MFDFTPYLAFPIPVAKGVIWLHLIPNRFWLFGFSFQIPVLGCRHF
jgi:hypothetical protein